MFDKAEKRKNHVMQ